MTVLKKANDTGRWTSVAAGIALVSMLATAPAAAESVNDIIRSLAPIAGQPQPPKPPKQRPVPYYPDPSGRPMTITIDYNYAYELVVYFPFDSAELTDFARNQLHALGTALQSPALTPYRYMIAGHTDAVGLPDYNQDLSVRRAHAVARYLVERYGIDPRRLFNTGWGATQLKDPRNPRSGINRRVEVVLVVDPVVVPAPPAVSGPGPVIINPPSGGGPVIVNPPPGTSSVKVRVEDQPVANPPAQPTTPPAANPCPPAAVRDNAARGNARDDFAGCETQSVPPGGRIIINSQ